MKQYRIAIAGAGIGGLSAALALARRGHQVTVYEQAASIDEVGAGLQLSPNAMKALRMLDIEDAIRAKASQPRALIMRYYSNDLPIMRLMMREKAEALYDAPYMHIHRADLLQVLQNACEKAAVTIQLNSAIDSYSLAKTHVQLQLSAQRTARFDILIGADGIHSNIQKQVCQSDAQFTGQVAWRGLIDKKNLPDNIDLEDTSVWVGPGKHFVAYGLRDSSLLNFVAVEEKTEWREESWSKQGDVADLNAQFANWSPTISSILAQCEQSFIWALYDRKPLDHWVDKRVCLLGDACHPMVPFLAQGAAAAIEDAVVLAQCLEQEMVISKALKKYEAARKPRTTQIQQAANKNAQLFHLRSPTVRWITYGSMALGSRMFKQFAYDRLEWLYGFDPSK